MGNIVFVSSQNRTKAELQRVEDRKTMGRLINGTDLSMSQLEELHVVFNAEYPRGLLTRARFVLENAHVHGGPWELWERVYDTADLQQVLEELAVRLGRARGLHQQERELRTSLSGLPPRSSVSRGSAFFVRAGNMFSTSGNGGDSTFGLQDVAPVKDDLPTERDIEESALSRLLQRRPEPLTALHTVATPDGMSSVVASPPLNSGVGSLLLEVPTMGLRRRPSAIDLALTRSQARQLEECEGLYEPVTFNPSRSQAAVEGPSTVGSPPARMPSLPVRGGSPVIVAGGARGLSPAALAMPNTLFRPLGHDEPDGDSLWASRPPIRTGNPLHNLNGVFGQDVVSDSGSHGGTGTPASAALRLPPTPAQDATSRRKNEPSAIAAVAHHNKPAGLDGGGPLPQYNRVGAPFTFVTTPCLNFEQYILLMHQDIPVEGRLKRIFVICDVDGDGFLNKSDLTVSLTWLFELSECRHLRANPRVMGRFTEGDAEYLRVRQATDQETGRVRSAQLPRLVPTLGDPELRAMAILAAMDVDEDGVLNEEEFREGCKMDYATLQLLSGGGLF